MITKRQLRGARGLLGRTQSDLAEASNISRETLADFEALTAIMRAFSSAGVQFIGESGVRLRSDCK